MPALVRADFTHSEEDPRGPTLLPSVFSLVMFVQTAVHLHSKVLFCFVFKPICLSFIKRISDKALVALLAEVGMPSVSGVLLVRHPRNPAETGQEVGVAPVTTSVSPECS